MKEVRFNYFFSHSGVKLSSPFSEHPTYKAIHMPGMRQISTGLLKLGQKNSRVMQDLPKRKQSKGNLILQSPGENTATIRSMEFTCIFYHGVITWAGLGKENFSHTKLSLHYSRWSVLKYLIACTHSHFSQSHSGFLTVSGDLVLSQMSPEDGSIHLSKTDQMNGVLKNTYFSALTIKKARSVHKHVYIIDE